MGLGWLDALSFQEKTLDLALHMECPNSQMMYKAMQYKEPFVNRQGSGAHHMTLWAEEMQDMDSLSFKGHLGRAEVVWDS